MIRNYLLIVILFVNYFNGVSQTSTDIFQSLESRKSSDGFVVLQQENGIADLVKFNIEQNKKLNGIEGWRIQLYSGSGINAKKEAQEIKGQAMTEFPDQKVYLIYNAPFWRVRVGDFRDKSESLSLYYSLKKKFENCYPVKDSDVQYKGFETK